MNRDVIPFRSLNAFIGTMPFADAFTHFIINDYVVLTIGGLVFMGIWFSGEQYEQRAVVITLIAFGLTLVVVQNSWRIYYPPRPFSEMDVKLPFNRPTVSLFPSLPIAIAFCYAEGVRPANSCAGV